MCRFIAYIVTLFLIAASPMYNASAQKPALPLADYVDPFIGVLDPESACVIGPQLPSGAINPSPQTPNGNDDGYDPNEPIRGFCQLSVSGTGWGKYGQVFVSPQIGLAVGESEHDSPKNSEVAKAYEYSVRLSRYQIQASLTPAFHSAIYRFTFPASNEAHIAFDISHFITDLKPALGGKVHEGSIAITSADGKEIKGFGVYSGGFGQGNYKVYFVARFSKAAHAIGTWHNGKITAGNTSQKIEKDGDRVGAYLQYHTTQNEAVYMKVAVSHKSIERAAEWLDAEIPSFDYNQVKETAKATWNKELGKIVVEGGSTDANKIFYTALYHANIMPRNRTNDTEHFADGVPVWDDHFAIWDTWRTLYPLQALINPTMVAGTVNSFIARLKKNNMVKDAFIAGNEMLAEQGGNNIDNVIADAYVKGIEGVDWSAAYQVLKHNADNERQGSFGWNKSDSTNTYKEWGWIPVGRMSNSMTLEYAYNDFCAAQVAKKLGTKQDYEKYLSRSGKWVNLWNANAESDGFKGFIDSKRRDGTFVNIDLKKYPGSWKDHFYEGSSWTYSWFAPHQFDKLVELCGGKDIFIKKLQHGFEQRLINYGNEPAFLAVHAFHYAGRSDLASYYTRELMASRFNLKGYSGNDDSGAMCSWFIFSSMGFFPNAGQDIYYLVGPSFTTSTITLGNKKTVEILAPNASPENIYVRSVNINGKKWDKPWFNHKDIANGATIVFDMASTPVAGK